MNKYDVILLVDAGIGNIIQTMYSVEYLQRLNVKVGIHVAGVNKSFKEYLKTCYKGIIKDDLDEVETVHLLHGFTYQKNKLPKHEHYYYVSCDYHSSHHYSETEQFLNIVKGLYPEGNVSERLENLTADYSERVKRMELQDKIVLYPGGSSSNSVRRWPHFPLLIKKMEEKYIIVGGMDDLNFSRSFIYPSSISFLPQGILNSKVVWSKLKQIKLLTPWAHHELTADSNAFFNKFSWSELVAVFSSCKGFVGNDGGLTHLAGACGSSGVVFFGPTSSKKNKTFNSRIEILENKVHCSPCQFSVGNISMTKNFINCPNQVKCLSDIDVSVVLEKIKLL